MNIEQHEGHDGCKIIINCGGGHHHHRCDCPSEFAEVYSLLSQTLAASPGMNMSGGAVFFENTVTATPNIDVSMAAVNGSVKINKAGWYRVNKSVSGALTPLGVPLVGWSMGLFVNGVIIPPSVFANVTISPAQQANQTTAVCLVHFDAGDILTLANTSVSVLGLNSYTMGSNATPVSAELNISLLKAD